MGSIEVFPRRRGRAPPLPQAWRSTPLPGAAAIRVREARIEDFASLRSLHRRLDPPWPACSLKQLENRLHVFPAGQWVAESDGHVVGAASSLVVQWDDYGADHTWRGITGDGSFSTHDSSGRTLYGAELLVEPSRRGYAIARALVQARRKLCRQANLRRTMAAVPLVGYAASGETISPELFAMRVVWGDLTQASMRLHIALGFQYCGVLRGYLPEHEATHGHAALMAWINPMYAPPEPPAFEESERLRKCA
ncbi:MAG TPA: GNAT family N-acetyltransferase [Usitatibacter sp.]|nr:GNAT family N-acetyltransferase [Usitatibacter sp.]